MNPINYSGLVSSARKDKSFQRLFDAKIKSNLEKGLYFLCNEKYRLNHRVKFWQLQVMIMSEEDRREEGEFVRMEDKQLEMGDI